MKITVMNAELADLVSLPSRINAYIKYGYADEDRPRHRDGVVIGRDKPTIIWGDRNHIRVAFSKKDPSHDQD